MEVKTCCNHGISLCLLFFPAAERTPSKPQESDLVSIKSGVTQGLIPSDLPW